MHGIYDIILLIKGSIENTRVKLLTKLKPSLETGLQNYIPLLKTSSNTVKDYGSENTTHTVTGASLLYSGINRTMYFDGTDDHINIGNLTAPGTSDMAVSFWIKRQGTLASNSDRHIFSINGSSVSTTNLSIALRQTNEFRIFFGNIDSGVFSSTVSDNKWHHLVLNCDRSGSATFYVDGELTDTFTISSGSAYNIGSSGSKALGRRAVATFSYWEGQLKYFRFYTRLLTTQEIHDIKRMEG